MATDNSAWALKQAIRQRVADGLADGSEVLEAFAGEGKMYRSVWRRFRGACIDLDAKKAEAAACERPDWAVYMGDSIKALRGGWMAHRRFDVVDLDAYGEPWTAFGAWCDSSRARADVTSIVLTDGYFARRGLAGCRVLWGEGKARSCSREQYFEQARSFVKSRLDANGLALSRGLQTHLSKNGRMAYYTLAVRAAG